jgi:hypothetical protein
MQILYFYPNVSELNRHGRGSLLARQALYEPIDKTRDIKHVLHTEPSPPRSDSYGLSHQAQLRWHDKD